MVSDFSIDIIAGVIQVSVAPVFLLVGISGLLNMLSGRLGRIIDRKRIVDAGLHDYGNAQQMGRLRIESERLERRIDLANRSIRLCVSSALSVCLLVVSLFLAEYVVAEVGLLIASLFMLAMLLIIGALVAMLAEVGIATRQARDGSVDLPPDDADKLK